MNEDRPAAAKATIACCEALERLVRGELYYAGRWVMMADGYVGQVLDAEQRRLLSETLERIEGLGVRCQRATASRRCAECDAPLRFGDRAMCTGCRLVLVERILSTELWREARPSSVRELEFLRDRLDKVRAKGR